jgi:predicted nucleotide-binding protein (sugar kinase/HSP70/actin superfamily)
VDLNCDRLDSLLDKHGFKTVDLWSLDMQGFEEDKALVAGTTDLTKYEVKYIVMEQQDIQ